MHKNKNASCLERQLVFYYHAKKVRPFYKTLLQDTSDI